MFVVFFNKDSGGYVQVKVNGKVYAEYSLNRDGKYVIDGVNGHNTLVIKDGYARVVDATCPDKVCEHMGKISRVGQSIVCLPNKVVVEIIKKNNESGNDGETEYDGVVK